MVKKLPCAVGDMLTYFNYLNKTFFLIIQFSFLEMLANQSTF